MFARSAKHADPVRRLRRFGRSRAPARGFIMGYILFALTVLGIVVAVLSRINDAEAETKWVADGTIRVRENLQNIRVQVITCSALLGSSEGSGDIVFPPQASPTEPTPLNLLKCPQGTLSPIGLFDGSAGVFLPAPPQGFTPYLYTNTYDTAAPGAEAAVYVETTVSSPTGAAVLNRIARSASGPDTVVTTAAGVTRLRYYLAKREGAS
jgi:hypothetical protein